MDIPEIVTPLSPENGSKEISLSSLFKWASAQKVETYRLQVSNDETFTNVTIDTVLADTTLQIDDLSYESHYWWRIMSENTDSISDWSDPFSFKTRISLPVKVALIEPANGAFVETDTIYFSWNQSEPRVQNYNFELAIDASFNDLVVDSVISDTAIQISNLTEAETFWWRVRAENDEGWSDYSDVRSFERIITSIGSNAEIPNQFELKQNFPNPFNPSTQIRFGIPEASNVQLEIYNIMGQHVITLVDSYMEAGWHKVTLDGSGFASGIYLFRLKAGSYSEVKRLTLLK